jgi:hypothetical protein
MILAGADFTYPGITFHVRDSGRVIAQSIEQLPFGPLQGCVFDALESNELVELLNDPRLDSSRRDCVTRILKDRSKSSA